MEQDISIREVVKELVFNHLTSNFNKCPLVPVGISNRHIHLSRKDINILFGESYKLTKLRELSQKGQYAAKESLNIIGPRGIIEQVRILGPERQQTQVEIMMSDTYILGVRAPVRESGDLKTTPGVVLSGPKGIVKLNTGVIVAKRHIHMTPKDSGALGLKDKDEVTVETLGERQLSFHKVVIRVDTSFSTEFHIDMDEANSAGIIKGDFVKLNF